MSVSLSNFFETKVQGELKSDQHLNYIPTTFNGRVNLIKQDNEINSIISKWKYICNFLKEFTVKLFKTKDKYLECYKPKVLLMGDSHVNDCHPSVKLSVDVQPR
jgi:hypothetical protein